MKNYSIYKGEIRVHQGVALNFRLTQFLGQPVYFWDQFSFFGCKEKNNLVDDSTQQCH